jgi:catechol 2,3-dioxygenase-like lactoylglutathione lyase family enzyme
MSETPCKTTETQTTRAAARVASSVMRVSDLDRSVRFYRDVFSCQVALREQDAALLLTPDGFQIYLTSQGPFRRHGAGPGGVQYLVWATDSEAELERITQRLLAYDPATYTHVENGVTFVEGCEPDHSRVIVAYPGPNLRPRELIAARFRGHH